MHLFQSDWRAIFEALNIPLSEDYLPVAPDAPSALVLCRGGNTRSAAITFLLRYKYGVDAIAGSLEKNTPSLLGALSYFCRYVVVTSPEMVQTACATLKRTDNHVVLCDIGPRGVKQANPFALDFLLYVDNKLKEALPWLKQTNVK